MRVFSLSIGAFVASSLFTACSGSKKGPTAPQSGKSDPAGAKANEGPVTGTFSHVEASSIALAFDLPPGFRVEPLGEGKSQVDLTDDQIKINLLRRPVGELALPHKGCEEKLVGAVAREGGLGAVELWAQLPPGCQGEAFGWTVVGRFHDGGDQIECYALLASSAQKTRYEEAVRRVCLSVVPNHGSVSNDGGAVAGSAPVKTGDGGL